MVDFVYILVHVEYIDMFPNVAMCGNTGDAPKP